MDTRVEEQEQVDFLVRRAMFHGFIWVAGVGSYRAIGYARQALKVIKNSRYKLLGSENAKFAFGLGIFGLCIWIPFIVIGIIISATNN